MRPSCPALDEPRRAQFQHALADEPGAHGALAGQPLGGAARRPGHRPARRRRPGADQSAAAALVSLGALPAITGDNGGPYRNRALSIGSTVFGGALGYLLGNLISGHGLWTAGAMTLLVLAASLVGTFNNIAAVATLQFAVYVIVGASLTSTLPPWLPSVLVGAGGLFGLALTLTGWVVNPIAPDRAAVAMAYRKLAAMFRPSAPRGRWPPGATWKRP